MFTGHRPPGGPRLPPIVVSLAAHAVLLALVATGDPPARRRQPRNRYAEVIEPNEKKLVWYRFKDKLPEIAPPKADGPADAPRADRIASQTIRSKQNALPGNQRIWRPEPAPILTAEIPSPNVIAVAAPKSPAKLYTPPELVKTPAPPVMLPDAPIEARANLPREAPLTPSRLPAKKYQPPKFQAKASTPDLPDAPIARAELPDADPLSAPKLPPKRFTPPEPAKTADPVAQLPDAPSTPRSSDVSRTAALTLPARKLTKKFTPPPAPPRTAGGPRGPLPDAPQPSAPLVTAQPALAGPALPGRPRYTPPGARPNTAAPPPGLDEAPALPAGTGANLSAAVVGLNPTNTPVPELPGIKPADIAAGPGINKTTDGAGAPSPNSAAAIPGLIVRGAIGSRTPPSSTAASQIAAVMNTAPTSRATLSAAIRNPAAASPNPDAPRRPAADFAFSGRTVYSMVIQMPNVTSSSGSWMMWFAERDPRPGPLEAPAATRKVDPIYPRAAVDERRQGRVRVAAILGADGRIGDAVIVKGVDTRIDDAALIALRKWEFTPARRNGTPVAVDAIVEIPFLLAPLDKP